MRAAFLEGPEGIVVRDTPFPAAEDGLVEIEVTACGICGSDLHGWRHPERTVAAGAAALPGIGGHEVVALVAGERRVVVEPNLAGSCGACLACREGKAWFCRERRPLPAWGFSERMHVRPGSLFDVPPGVADRVASLTEPLACAVHAFRWSHTAALQGGTLEGCRVAVIGAGVTGLLATASATRLGAGPVLVIARYPHQAASALEQGATEALDADGGDALAAARTFGPDIVVEAVGGTADTFDLSVRAVKPGGEVLVLGLFDEPQQLDVRRAVFRDLRLGFPVTYGVVDGHHDFAVALEFLESDPDGFAPLVSHRFGLDDAAEAFATAADKSTGALRVVVEP